MDVGFDGESPLVIASKYVQSYTGNQIDLGVQADLFGTSTQVIVCNDTIEGVR